ncbi:fatty-acid amide hydrolase 2-like [Rhodnius prolixus]|uniref:Amidase domain-containing protein n=2 Tax=Rhodnius TaxID=13248 RepID=T1HQS6_RHOPR
MEILMLLVGIFQRLIFWILRPFYYINSLRSKPRLPAISSPYLHMSVVQIARKIREGEIKSRDIVDACIERIKAVNPIVNAIVQDRFKEAQKEADEVDEYIAANLDNVEKIEKDKPLLGIPFTVKETCSLKGMSFAIGCLLRKGTIAEDDGEAVKELKKAGGIPIAVTNTPEYGMSWETNNLVTGCTRNPYNFYRSAGGSSGGEGAIISSAGSLCGIGSDLGGSIRLPAMFNGIFGHKPTPGYVSLEGHYPYTSDHNFQKYLVLGPLARHAEDLSLLMNVLLGERAQSLQLDKPVLLSEINVLFIEEATNSLDAVPVAKEIKMRMQEAVHYLKTAHGCRTEKGKFELANSINIGLALVLGIKGIPNLLDSSVTKKKGELNAYVECLKSMFGLSEISRFGALYSIVQKLNLYSKRKYEKYYKLNEDLKNSFKDTLKDNGVLLYPTFPVPAIHHNEIFILTHAVMYPIIINTLELPATHVPLGLNKEGLPIGIQVVAGPHQDRLCLAVAKALEEKFGGWIPP